MKCYAGLDVSLKETAICVIDEEGTIIREGSVPSEPEDIAAWLSAHAAPIEKIGLEIGGISRWLHIELMKLGLPSVCIDPRRLRGLTKTMPVKSDRNDARAIAQVMRAGWYTQVHIKSEQSQKLKMLLTNRKILLTKVIDIENAIRGTLRVFGLRLAGRLATPQFERRARELVEDHPDLALMIEPMLAARAVLREQWARLDRMTLQVARVDPVCRLLMTAPGVGAACGVRWLPRRASSPS